MTPITRLYECTPCDVQKFYSETDDEEDAPARACEGCAQPLHRKRLPQPPLAVVVTETIVDGVTVAHAGPTDDAKPADDATGSP